MQLVFAVYNTYCYLMHSDLQDTTKNLKTLDHMLDNYRDVSRDQRSTNDRVSFESFPLKYPLFKGLKENAVILCFAFFKFYLFLSRGFLLSFFFLFFFSNFLHVAIFLLRTSLFIVCTV